MQALDHGPGGFVPERIVAFVDDDHGVGNPSGLVNGFLVVGVQRIEGIEPATAGIVYLGSLERIENLDRLPHALAIRRALAPARRRDGRVFSLRINDEDRARPEE